MHTKDAIYKYISTSYAIGRPECKDDSDQGPIKNPPTITALLYWGV